MYAIKPSVFPLEFFVQYVQKMEATAGVRWANRSASVGLSQSPFSLGACPSPLNPPFPIQNLGSTSASWCPINHRFELGNNFSVGNSRSPLSMRCLSGPDSGVFRLIGQTPPPPANLGTHIPKSIIWGSSVHFLLHQCPPLHPRNDIAKQRIVKQINKCRQWRIQEINKGMRNIRGSGDGSSPVGSRDKPR